MTIPESILHRLKQNEIIAKKFNEIETSILSILNFQDFFENLLTIISTTFQTPHVWISIIEESPISQYILAMEDSELLQANTGVLSQEAFTTITGNKIKPLLANTDMRRFKPLYPAEADYNVGSIAVAPISLDGDLIGSLNQGDSNIYRFKPGIDTALLERLALKISICLSNVTAHEQLKFLAFHDSLTGLLNRRVMEKILEREYQRSKRYRSDLSVIFFDLDDFKSINDSFGHDQGDTALKHAAKSFKKMKRNTDSVARFAGDEFVVILPSTGSKEAEAYVQRVKMYLKTNPVKTDGNEFFIKLSAGIASALEESIDSSVKLLKTADERLLSAKKERKPSTKKAKRP